MAEEVSSTTNEHNFSNSMRLIEEECELMTGATEEVEDLQSGPLSLFKEPGYIPVTNEHLTIHDLYQPLDLDDGRFTCKICHQMCPENAPIFANKNQFASHRYRCHGTFMNLLQCPEVDCNLQFSSIIALKKHLQTERNLPIESHYKHFPNVTEFEIWRSTVEQLTGSRFILHNRQAQSKRNVMHCVRSEHKVSSNTNKNRSRQGRMRKIGSQCPAHITFILDSCGSVDAVYQLFHFGHDLEEIRLFNVASREELLTQGEESLSINTIFPVSNRLPSSAAMQYVQLCLVDMPDAMYLSTRYSQLLVVLDVQSFFIFAKPIPNPRCVSQHVHKSHIIRQLVDIFTQFGCPVGFSVCGSSGVVFDSMESIEEVFNVNMTHVGNITPDLSFLKKRLLERAVDELSSSDRWPEVVPFTLMAYNSEGGGDKYLSPFEMMFGRRPPHSHDPRERMEEALKNQVDLVRFEEGDSVLVRYFDPDIIAEGPTPNASQQQPSTEYLNGVISEVDWYGSPFYPYKVFICRSTEEPNSDCPFVWVSPFDVSPLVGDIRNRRNEQRRKVATSFLCSCKRDQSRGEICMLPRSELCAHKMARVCCEKLNRRCDYHNEYSNGGGDSYKRVELLARRFIDKEKFEKEEEKILRSEPMRLQMGTENEEGIGEMDEGEKREILPSNAPSNIDLHPSTVTKIGEGMEEGEQLPSTSHIIRPIHRIIIAEKKPVVRGGKRKTEEVKEEEKDKKDLSPLKKKDPSSFRVFASGETSASIDESTGDRRKSGRVTKPNILYKSFTHH
ncbi:hypothetical protein PENTCL1PPCAC_22950 [Pristionchus entomophagus]|uniref:C2H2-type domain-containing protein n=1 Tax=Pristionchus entomophagus TaxID=358040 RepID=A0AAV5U1N2_9BILA|nr:hypothetical protein PENTCL1PPCAC_22950 [Pristionchus entomophagus]